MAAPDEQRKLVALRMLPSAHRQAKIAAVTEGKTLGVWIEEAIREKVEREGSPR
jgi:predicted HicB family RNase H-like nuclease